MTKPIPETGTAISQGFATFDAFEGPVGVFCDLVDRGRPALQAAPESDAGSDEAGGENNPDCQTRDGQLTVYAVARIVFRIGSSGRRSQEQVDDAHGEAPAFALPVEITSRDQQTWTARVRILHEQYGPVLAEITLCGEEVRVRFVVLSGMARDALLEERGELSQCLGRIGLSLSECDVHVGREESSIQRLPVDLGCWEDGR